MDAADPVTVVKAVSGGAGLTYRFPVRTFTRTSVVAAAVAALLSPLTAVSTSAAVGTTAGTPAAGLVARAAQENLARKITYREWDRPRQLRQARRAGTRVFRGQIVLDEPVARVRYRDPHGYRPKRYDVGRWVSRWQRPGHTFDELIPSWDAVTPRDSWVQIQVRVRSESGRRSGWYTMANWAHHDRTFHRTSLGAQADDLGEVAVDTLRARYSMGFTAWQMRVNLHRKAGTKARPRVDTVGAMTSLLPRTDSVRASRHGGTTDRVVLPGYSQMTHEGDYPEYDNGGEAWCSPTSVSMVLGGLDRLPAPRQYAWVPEGHHDRWVDHAARSQYDYGYDGAGNWSFSTAYAAQHADNAFVTRLRHLGEAERFIRAGIPLVASVRFGRGELAGSPISSTAGHLLVIVGFTETGDVVVNDPAADDNGSVVRTYDRGQFENAWIPKSGGLVYVIHDDDQPLPASPTASW